MAEEKSKIKKKHMFNFHFYNDFIFYRMSNKVQYPWHIFDKNNNFKAVWDVFILFLVIGSTFILPLELTFLGQAHEDENEHDHGYVFTFVSQMIIYAFLIDILLNTRVAYENKDGDIEVSSKEMFKHYICSYDFLIDFVSTIPFEKIHLE